MNELKQYLLDLKWDGVPRAEKMLPSLFGARNSEYTRAVGKCWLVDAVSRALNPGCKLDTVLILEGKQGSNKSCGLAALCPNPSWFTNSPINLYAKNRFQNLHGKWLIEIGELDSFKPVKAAKMKAFLSASADTYRPRYGTHAETFPRACVFVGSTNEQHYFTGNRCFWPVACERKIDVDGIVQWRDQLWAEAVHLHRIQISE